jgi:hypothetical protein
MCENCNGTGLKHSAKTTYPWGEVPLVKCPCGVELNRERIEGWLDGFAAACAQMMSVSFSSVLSTEALYLARKQLFETYERVCKTEGREL